MRIFFAFVLAFFFVAVSASPTSSVDTSAGESNAHTLVSPRSDCSMGQILKDARPILDIGTEFCNKRCIANDTMVTAVRDTFDNIISKSPARSLEFISYFHRFISSCFGSGSFDVCDKAFQDGMKKCAIKNFGSSRAMKAIKALKQNCLATAELVQLKEDLDTVMKKYCP